MRSHGGWTALKNLQRESLMKGDERILGDSSFVLKVLALAEERLEKRYAMRQSGMTLEGVEKKVAALFGMTPRDLLAPGKQKPLSDARSLVCFFAVHELGIPMKDLAERFSLSGPAISYAVRKGRNIAEEKGWSLSDGE